MKTLHKVAVMGVLAVSSAAGHAGLVPILTAAIELIQAIPTASPPVAGANASIGLDSGATVGSIAQGFSGRGTASASVDIDRFRETSAEGSASWEYVFLVAQPGITDILVNYTYSGSESVFTNFNANARANASASGLEAFLNVGAFAQHLTWPGLALSGDCSSSGLFDDCGPSPRAVADASEQVFHYDPGYPVGTRIRLLGNILASAFGHTGIGSAESSASSGAAFSIRAVPVPGTLPLTVLALAGLFLVGRRGGTSLQARRTGH